MMMDNNPTPTPNNQPNPNFTVMPPASPQGNPVGPKITDSRFKRLISNPVSLIIALIVMVLFIAVLAFLIFTRGVDKKDSMDGRKTAAISFKDWLEPKSEIKIGNNRYVSTCQILSPKTVVNTMYNGKPPATFAVNEDYYDASPVQEKYVVPTTECRYGEIVTLEAEQLFDAEDVKLLSNSVSTAGDQYIEAKIAAYKKAVEASTDDSLRKFVDQIETSTTIYLEKKDSYSRKDTEGLDTSTLIIPVGNDAVGFNLFSDNVVYELNISSKLRASGITEAPSDQILTQLTQAKKLTDEIRKNSQNKQLTQSPGLSILSDKAKVGQTYVLEPCAILSADNVQKITGASQANIIERMSVKYDLDDVVVTKSGYAVFPSNSCTRTVNLPAGSTVTKTLVNLQLEYAPDAAALDKKLIDGKFLPLDADDTQLQTSADSATEYVVTNFKPYYQFRVGSYWAYIKISTIDRTTSAQGQATREQHVAAINLLTESLKANIKEAEQNQGR